LELDIRVTFGVLGFVDTSTKVVLRISLFLNFVKRLMFQDNTKIRTLVLFPS